MNSKSFYDLTLDLHGMYADTAMELLAGTLNKRRKHSVSILVIHGNGTGMLRARIRGALQSGRLPCREYFFGEDIAAPGFDGVTVIHT